VSVAVHVVHAGEEINVTALCCTISQ